MELNKILKEIFTAVCVIAFWIAIWQIASVLVSDNLKLFLPGPVTVIRKWMQIGFTPDYLKAAGATLTRIFIGFVLGVLTGFCAGLLTANFKIANAVIAPAFKVVRAVPVVSFIILAFLFIKVDSLPIFISFLMVLPLIWQTVHDAITNSNRDLDELCRVYKLGKLKTLFIVKLPQCLPEIISASVSALGFAWKSGVAAEVLCAPDISLGHRIYNAKAALNFDEVYAVTLTVVLLSIIIELLLKYISKKYFAKRSSTI